MKGKIFVGLLLGVIGVIYVFLIYPLLQNTEFRSENTGNVILSETKDPAINNEFLDSSATPQNDDIKKRVADRQQPAADSICFNTTCFTIEIADTFASRQQGLMNRPSLLQDAGMLFVFDTLGAYGFWMKNTLIPLDIIWMDENFIVVDTATMTPCTADPCPIYNHNGQAMYVLEINAGLVQKYGIVPGQQFTRK